MHNTYFSSAVYSVRCRESFPLSFNFSYERFDRSLSHGSSCCGYCDCCALFTYRVPIKPYLLNGLRQSSLLQLSASRRLYFGGGDQYFSRIPTYGLLRRCYKVNCYSNDRRTVCNRSRRRTNETCFCAALQKGKENFPSSGSDDYEIILNFLSEEADKDATGVKWKDVSLSKRMEAEKNRRNVSSERHLSLSEKIKTERKGNMKQNETSSIDVRREFEKPNNDREAFTKGENGRKRRNLSSCSSYYSLSSGDFENDLEVHGKVGLEELSPGHEKNEANHMERKIKEEFNRQREESKVYDVSNRERALGSDINWNIRKKSEKKLTTTESTTRETESTSEHQDMHRRASIVDGSGYGKTSISQKQVHCKKDNSSFVENLDKKTNMSDIQTPNRRMHHSTDIQESGCNEVETTMLSGKTFSGREGNHEISETLLKKTSDEHEKFVGSTSITGKESSKSKKTFSGKEGNLKISETLLQETSDEQKKFVASTYTTKDVIDRSSQSYIGNSNIEETATALDTRMKNVEEKKESTFSSAQAQQYKAEKVISPAKDGRRKYQQSSEVSQAHGKNVEDALIVKNVEDALIVKSKTSVKNREGSSSLSSDAKDTLIQTDRRPTQSFKHSKGSEHGRNLLEGYASNEKQYSSSQIAFEKMRFIPKSKLLPFVKTRESSSQTDKRIFGHRKLSISDKNASEKSSFQGSLNSVSETGKHAIIAEGHPIVGEIVNISGSDISRTESVVPIKEPVCPAKSELSGSERRDGELKQRMFQRNKQIIRDRFDDWEDAYKLELEQRRIDEMFMNEAILEATKAADTWEVPVGAVLVQHGKIIARGCNLVEELRDSTAHAEMICIREASKLLHSWRLSETTLYVTLEPCPMCAGAILQARVDTVVWGAPNKLLGADGSWIRLFPDEGETSGTATDMPPPPVHPFHPNIKIRRRVLATECADAMQQFFQLRRRNKKEESPKDPSSLRVNHPSPSKLLNKLHDIFHVMCL